MAARHILSLDFPETANKGIFRIKDSSVYSSLIGVSCATLEITPPGYSSPGVLTVDRDFDLVLNACSMGILGTPYNPTVAPPSTPCDDSCPDLPDGIYNIRYSVSPNDKVYVEYRVLRTVKFYHRYAKVMCGIPKGCAPDAETEAKIREMQLIDSFVQAAHFKVEEENVPDEGMDLLRYAIKRLSKFSCATC
jgi:hypothetical protein